MKRWQQRAGASPSPQGYKMAIAAENCRGHVDAIRGRWIKGLSKLRIADGIEMLSSSGRVLVV